MTLVEDHARQAGREALRPFYDAFATGDLAALDRVFLPHWQDRTLPRGRTPGLAGLKEALLFLRRILPDVSTQVEEVRADGDIVTVRSVFRGTNTGGFPGVPANGAAIAFIAFDMHRLVDGRVVESWHLEDNLALMAQLGVISLPG